MPGSPELSPEDLQGLKDWFFQYVHSFYSQNPLIQKPLKLKEDHSLRVGTEILNIGRELALSAQDLRIAEAMALFHDIGRFAQITRYQTFVDGKSANHAALGVQVLEQEKVLAALTDATQALILKAVSYHNRLNIPAGESPECVFYSRLLRDADKVDILALFSRYYREGPEERSSAVELDLPDRPEVSADVLATLQQGAVVSNRQLKTLNDFKLLQLAWVYDINFPPTLRIIRERHYLKNIRDTLPVSEQIDRIYARMLSFLEEKLSAEAKDT